MWYYYCLLYTSGNAMRKLRKTLSMIVTAAVTATLMPACGVINKGQGEEEEKKLVYEKYPRLQGCMGWEGDINAPFINIDGSYVFRKRNIHHTIHFEVYEIDGKINWYNAEGYLPCFISEYVSDGMNIKIENFADQIIYKDNPLEAVYTRITVKNISDAEKTLPQPQNAPLTKLYESSDKKSVAPGETSVREYVFITDYFGNDEAEEPKSAELAQMGRFDEHYNHMKEYWNNRLDGIANITALPDERLINAYKAGYIYTLIVKDGYNLNVGENGYDQIFDHDIIGIVSTLFTLGDFEYAKEYIRTIPEFSNYDDAAWKSSWVYAQYLLKTSDTAFIEEEFETISHRAHKIETDIDPEYGIIKKTFAIDSHGYWTIDDQSALTGLAAYKYICERLGKPEEAEWARKVYDKLLNGINSVLSDTMQKYGINYIPMSPLLPNDQTDRKDPRDANWASMMLFGRWSWDGYLFGAEQSGCMLDLIDSTYDYGIENRKEVSDSIYNFGGYPHGFYSSAYNAGYGSAALRGEKYRDMGIKAYQFMIDNSMCSPFGWWEGIGYQNDESPWSITHASTGEGSNPHMWGQSVCTKVLIDSIISLKSDGSLIIGRGIPDEWLGSGKKIALDNFAAADNKRVGLTIKTDESNIILELSGTEEIKASLELNLLKNNIKSAGGLEFDSASGKVTIPAGVSKIRIETIN